MTRHMKTLCTFVAVAACLVVAAPAAAQVTVAGTGEPAFTNSTQNTQWFSWQVPSSADSYRLKYRYYKDNVLVYETSATTTTSGTGWANWSGVATLQEGSQYAICVQGEYSFPNDSLYFPDGPNSCSMATMEGKRSHTTIDRTKPTTSVTVAGGAEYVKQGQVPVSIGFQDATAGPNPATFLCVEAGTGPCQGQHQHSPQCSQPAGPGKSTTFGCTVDASALPDGTVKVCAIGADASVPDNPSSANQTASASQANRSDSTCDTVVLDRNGPALTLNASKTTVQAGESVAFSGHVSDAISGLDQSTHRWEFSDGAPAIAGNVASRSFAQPGTYVVTFRAKDQAGNESTAQQTITVTAPPAGAGEVPPPLSPPPPGNDAGTPGKSPVTGNGSLASVQVGGVTVLVPKRLKLGKVKTLTLGARTDQAGTLTLRLTRGKRTYSKLTVRLAPGETTQRLRLPKGLRPGSYAVRIAFKPAGARRSAAGTARVALQKAKGR